MNRFSDAPSRRKFLKLTGGSVAMIPLLNLYGCGNGEPDQMAPVAPPEVSPSPAPEAVAPEPEPQATAAADEPAEAPGTAEEMPRLEEDAPQAQALGYKHDATEVDASAYPGYESGELCSNCSLYVADQGEEGWGGCQIFPGRLVNADGWCTAYVPMA